MSAFDNCGRAPARLSMLASGKLTGLEAALRRYLLLFLRLFPGLPGPVPGPSLTLGFPGGCGSNPLPTPLLPFRLSFLLSSSPWPEPLDANDDTAFKVRIAGAI